MNRPVEQTQYWATAEDIVAQFGAVTWQPEILRGVWLRQGARYEEENVRFFVDADDTPETLLSFSG